jgi:NAD+ kinase
VTERPKIRSVALCVKPDAPAAANAARELLDWLEGRGIEVAVDREGGSVLERTGEDRAVLAETVDLFVVVGGDGTLLSVGRELGGKGVPILGIHMGTLGFLAEVMPDEQEAVLARVLDGDYETFERTLLDVRAQRGETLLLESSAINDVVITRSDQGRLIDVDARADGADVGTYHSDGVIFATPTGSTAYTLSAGGPIVLPGARVYVVTPICPHTLTQRPLVLPEDTLFEAVVHPRRGTAQLTIDGQLGVELEDGDRVIVQAARHGAVFVASPFRSRFDVLRQKLGWGAV